MIRKINFVSKTMEEENIHLLLFFFPFFHFIFLKKDFVTSSKGAAIFIDRLVFSKRLVIFQLLEEWRQKDFFFFFFLRFGS